MKGLYVARLDLNQPHLMGVSRKVHDQMDALRHAGVAMDLLCMSEGKISQAAQVVDGVDTSAPVGRWARRINHHVRFHHAMVEAARDVDFIYIRFQGAPIDFGRALARIRKASPDIVILLEMPSWPYHTERRGLSARLRGLYEDSGLASLRSSVDRVVTFSQSSEILGIPTLKTDNGVATETLPVLPCPEMTDTIRLIGVANLSFWHGYDRVISGLAAYNQPKNGPRIVFDIAGSGAERSRLEGQVRTAGLDGVVTFLGPLHGEALQDRMEQAHIGISSVGMHRLDVDTSNIKSREFCARGLPFVIGYPDRDFGQNLAFVHHISAEDTPLDIAGLIAWYSALRQEHPGFSALMRQHAETHLTWHAKMAPVVDWLNAQRAG